MLHVKVAAKIKTQKYTRPIIIDIFAITSRIIGATAGWNSDLFAVKKLPTHNFTLAARRGVTDHTGQH